MATYIHGIGNISPQKSWGEEGLLEKPVAYAGDRLTCVEPDYQHYLEVQQLRRMSRILKMGAAAGKMALTEAGLAVPDGIITGTSYGCLEDTGIFLKKMVENKELALNPTPFIQSTHNTIGSQIALLLKCQGYNQTYTQGAFSLESSLLDAILALKENPEQSLLTGGVDEITETSHTIQKRFGIFGNSMQGNLDLFSQEHGAPLNGEGAAYFVLSGEQRNARVCIDSITTFYKPDRKFLTREIGVFLDSAGIAQPEFTLLGKCGDKKLDAETDEIYKSISAANSPGLFKHLSGEYPTAASFALWLGARIIQNQYVPECLGSGKIDLPVRNLLIYNPYFGQYHSLILLRAC
jgi:3-oxoacyl-[acyl-carrier-protein] synthase II